VDRSHLQLAANRTRLSLQEATEVTLKVEVPLLVGQVDRAVGGPAEGIADRLLRVLVKDDGRGAVVPPGVVPTGENARHLHGEGVRRGALEVVNTLLHEEVGDDDLTVEQHDSGVNQLLRLDDGVSHVSAFLERVQVPARSRGTCKGVSTGDPEDES